MSNENPDRGGGGTDGAGGGSGQPSRHCPGGRPEAQEIRGPKP